MMLPEWLQQQPGLVEVPEAPGWYRVTVLTPLLFAKYYQAAEPYLGDEYQWYYGPAWVAKTLFFVNAGGYVMFADVENRRATIHGGTWNLKRAAGQVENVQQLCRVVFKANGWDLIIGYTPDVAKGMLRFLGRVGFKPCGIIPQALFINGKPVAHVLNALRPEDLWVAQ